MLPLVDSNDDVAHLVVVPSSPLAPMTSDLPRRYSPGLPVTGAWQPGMAGGRLRHHGTDDRPFVLECGATLDEVVMAYETWGDLDAMASNAVLVCHALTGDSHAAGPTPGPSQSRAGGTTSSVRVWRSTPTRTMSCASTCSAGARAVPDRPASIRPPGSPYGSRFPTVTIRDMVRAQARVAEKLGIGRWKAVIGGSMGGMQVLEWAAMFPDRVRAIAPIATALAASAQQIAWSAVGRMALALDPRWRGGDYYDAEPGDGPHRGLAVARAIAQIHYRSDESFDERFGRALVDPEHLFGLWDRFQVESYLDYQGEKLARRFDANSYLVLNKSMDTHDLARARGSMTAAVRRLRCRWPRRRSPRTSCTRPTNRPRSSTVWRRRAARRCTASSTTPVATTGSCWPRTRSANSSSTSSLSRRRHHDRVPDRTIVEPVGAGRGSTRPGRPPRCVRQQSIRRHSPSPPDAPTVRRRWRPSCTRRPRSRRRRSTRVGAWPPIPTKPTSTPATATRPSPPSKHAMAELEGAEAARAFSSGMGAISAVVLGLCSTGDHIVTQRQLYAGTQLLFQSVCPRFGIDVTFVDAAEPGAFAAAVRPGKTMVVFAETPANPRLDLVDLDELGAIAGPVTVVDSTFAPPLIQRPLDHGVDLSLHSATKAIGGHNDATLGVVSGSEELLTWLWGFAVLQGANAAPFDAMNGLRGLRTLGVRLERQSTSALALAQELEAHPGGDLRAPSRSGQPSSARARQAPDAPLRRVVDLRHRRRVEAGRRFVEATRIASSRHLARWTRDARDPSGLHHPRRSHPRRAGRVGHQRGHRPDVGGSRASRRPAGRCGSGLVA